MRKIFLKQNIIRVFSRMLVSLLLISLVAFVLLGVLHTHEDPLADHSDCPICQAISQVAYFYPAIVVQLLILVLVFKLKLAKPLVVLSCRSTIHLRSPPVA